MKLSWITAVTYGRRCGGGEVGRWWTAYMEEESGKGCTFGLPRRKKIVLGGCERGKLADDGPRSLQICLPR